MNEIRSSVVPKLLSDSAILPPRAALEPRARCQLRHPAPIRERPIDPEHAMVTKSHFCFGAGCFGADVFEAVPIFRAGVFLAGALTGFGKPVKSIVVIFTGSYG